MPRQRKTSPVPPASRPQAKAKTKLEAAPASESSAEAGVKAEPAADRKRRSNGIKGKRGRKPSNHWRVHVTVPGLLWPAIQQRWAEFGYSRFSDYAVELVCFDLRTLYGHRITQPFGDELQPVQDAIDRQIAAHYAPGKPREECFMLRVLRGELEVPGRMGKGARAGAKRTADPAPATGGSVCLEGGPVSFPGLHRPCIVQRWKALGYGGVSNYVTGLIRYDLALGGPHRYFNGADKDPQILASLDKETEATFREGKTQPIRLLDFIEEAAGRKLTKEEYLGEIDRLRENMKAAAWGAC